MKTAPGQITAASWLMIVSYVLVLCFSGPLHSVLHITPNGQSCAEEVQQRFIQQQSHAALLQDLHVCAVCIFNTLHSITPPAEAYEMRSLERLGTVADMAAGYHDSRMTSSLVNRGPPHRV